ncbi:tail fiber assembly protein [Escherichia sp. E1130]|uniref:tail fiber assembly protein n=2 Tax=Escherichia sp. E1130 TaxID=2041645 RepID=UPI0010810197|nr:tail fiber assembly protein [Escherichia sp. E1130]TGC25270.1 phage tail protein [Escherichia sp. E1130]
MSMYLFSGKTLAFYPASNKQAYIDAGTLPDDVVKVGDDVRDIYNFAPPEGKVLGVGKDGLPAWVDIPPEDLISAADVEKQNRIDQANDYMNSKQWPGKAAMGRLSDSDKTQYNARLDYLDALEAVDTSTAPDINWPEKPA